MKKSTYIWWNLSKLTFKRTSKLSSNPCRNDTQKPAEKADNLPWNKPQELGEICRIIVKTSKLHSKPCKNDPTFCGNNLKICHKTSRLNCVKCGEIIFKNPLKLLKANVMLIWVCTIIHCEGKCDAYFCMYDY